MYSCLFKAACLVGDDVVSGGAEHQSRHHYSTNFMHGHTMHNASVHVHEQRGTCVTCDVSTCVPRKFKQEQQLQQCIHGQASDCTHITHVTDACLVSVLCEGICLSFSLIWVLFVHGAGVGLLHTHRTLPSDTKPIQTLVATTIRKTGIYPSTTRPSWTACSL